MICDDRKLHSWYICPSTGKEGFADDLYDEFKHGYITDDDDLEYLVNVFTYSDDAEKGWVDEVREVMK